jgi:PleD family two-component response regulator
LSGGIAELAPGDDATTFFERADDALYRAKQAGKAQLSGA